MIAPEPSGCTSLSGATMECVYDMLSSEMLAHRKGQALPRLDIPDGQRPPDQEPAQQIKRQRRDYEDDNGGR